MNRPAPPNHDVEHELAHFARPHCRMRDPARQVRSPLARCDYKRTLGKQGDALPARAGLPGRAVAWYRLPILWLGALIFSASVAGCVLMMLLGSRHDDEPLPDAGLTLLKMPLGSSAPSRDPSRGTQ